MRRARVGPDQVGPHAPSVRRLPRRSAAGPRCAVPGGAHYVVGMAWLCGRRVARIGFDRQCERPGARRRVPAPRRPASSPRCLRIPSFGGGTIGGGPESSIGANAGAGRRRREDPGDAAPATRGLRPRTTRHRLQPRGGRGTDGRHLPHRGSRGDGRGASCVMRFGARGDTVRTWPSPTPSWWMSRGSRTSRRAHWQPAAPMVRWSDGTRGRGASLVRRPGAGARGRTRRQGPRAAPVPALPRDRDWLSRRPFAGGLERSSMHLGLRESGRQPIGSAKE